MKQTTVYYKISNTLINNLKHRDDIKILRNLERKQDFVEEDANNRHEGIEFESKGL